MNNIAIGYYKTPAGELIIGSFQDHICLCDWRYRKQREHIDQRIKNGLNANFRHDFTTLHQELITQLESYFNGSLQQFTIPLLTVGTPFQKKVWQELQQLSYGSTVSYASLSRKLEQPEAIRAVATANGANAISILIPCHRMIGSNGSLTGYAGGLNAKKKLLQFEGALGNEQLDLFN